MKGYYTDKLVGVPVGVAVGFPVESLVVSLSVYLLVYLSVCRSSQEIPVPVGVPTRGKGEKRSSCLSAATVLSRKEFKSIESSALHLEDF